MLARSTALILLLVYKQVDGFQINGTNNSPNMILNKTFTFNTPNAIRNRLSQLQQKQQSNLQQPDNVNLVKNFPQAFNLQTSNLQKSNAQQALNLQQGNLQPALTNNIQKSAMLQQPVNVQQATNNVYPSNLQQNINLQAQNQNVGNMQIMRQATDVPNGLFAQSYGGANPPVNSPVVTSQANLYNANTPSDLVSLVLPQQQMTNNVVCAQNQQVSYGTNPSEIVSGVCPQNQQLLYSSGTPYVTDISQVTNNIPSAISSPTFDTYGNQPSLMTVLPGPQQNQQQYLVQNPVATNPTDISSQITVVKSVQPCSGQQAMNQEPGNLINMAYPNGPRIQMPTPEGALSTNALLTSGLPIQLTGSTPSVNSLLASVLTKEASKSSSFKTLLPLILNLMKERNNCGCQHHCGCQNNSRMHHEGGGDIFDGYPNQRMFENQNFRPDNFKYSNDFSEEFDCEDNYDGRRNCIRHEKGRNMKPISAEYDYSDEQDEA